MAPKASNALANAPDFELSAEDGSTVTLNSALAGVEGGIVIFVYPKANTPGCTKQACGFRDEYEKFKANGFEVFGLSRDKSTAQSNWKTKQKLPYNLLCEGDSLMEDLKCFDGQSVSRSVYVILKANKQIGFSHIKAGPEESVKEALEFVLSQKGGTGSQAAKPAGKTTTRSASSKPAPKRQTRAASRPVVPKGTEVQTKRARSTKKEPPAPAPAASRGRVAKAPKEEVKTTRSASSATKSKATKK